ncbi:unnamed protein product, partial [Brassica rapa]
MSNTQLHGRTYNSQNTLASFAHIIERKLLPFSPAHVRPPRL